MEGSGSACIRREERERQINKKARGMPLAAVYWIKFFGCSRHFCDVDGLWSFRSALYIEFHRLTLAQCAKALAAYSRVVHEHISLVLCLDETIPLLVIEPLNFTFRHCPIPFLLLFSLPFAGVSLRAPLNSFWRGAKRIVQRLQNTGPTLKLISCLKHHYSYVKNNECF